MNQAEMVRERSEEGVVHCASVTRWGEFGGMFSWREEPASLNFSLTLDLRAPFRTHPFVRSVRSAVGASVSPWKRKRSQSTTPASCFADAKTTYATVRREASRRGRQGGAAIRRRPRAVQARRVFAQRS